MSLKKIIDQANHEKKEKKIGFEAFLLLVVFFSCFVDWAGCQSTCLLNVHLSSVNQRFLNPKQRRPQIRHVDGL